MFSPDGRYIFFSAPGQGTGKDLFWVDAKIVEALKPNEFKYVRQVMNLLFNA